MGQLNENDMSSRDERAKRLRYLRDTLRLSMSKFAQLCEVQPSSIQNWEYARFGGLTEKGAKQLIKNLHKHGIDCSIEWLLYGIGKNPSSSFISNSALSHHAEINIVAKELSLFHELNPNAMDCMVTDDGMEPRFLPGDRVAGVRVINEDIEKTVGLPCIAQTISNNILVRVIERGDSKGLYNLVSTNPHTTVAEKVIKNVALISATPIIWIRRENY